jgi:hypothetical protein
MFNWGGGKTIFHFYLLFCICFTGRETFLYVLILKKTKYVFIYMIEDKNNDQEDQLFGGILVCCGPSS